MSLEKGRGWATESLQKPEKSQDRPRMTEVVITQRSCPDSTSLLQQWVGAAVSG